MADLTLKYIYKEKQHCLTENAHQGLHNIGYTQKAQKKLVQKCLTEEGQTRIKHKCNRKWREPFKLNTSVVFVEQYWLKTDLFYISCICILGLAEIMLKGHKIMIHDLSPPSFANLDICNIRFLPCKSSKTLDIVEDIDYEEIVKDVEHGNISQQIGIYVNADNIDYPGNTQSHLAPIENNIIVNLIAEHSSEVYDTNQINVLQNPKLWL